MKNLHDRKGVGETTLKFYIQQNGKFVPLSLEVTGLRDNCEPEMKQRHLDTIVDGLYHSLNEVLDREDGGGEEDEFEELNAVNPTGYQFRLESQRWQD